MKTTSATRIPRGSTRRRSLKTSSILAEAASPTPENLLGTGFPEGMFDGFYFSLHFHQPIRGIVRAEHAFSKEPHDQLEKVLL
jgi:hypothetical protein